MEAVKLYGIHGHVTDSYTFRTSVGVFKIINPKPCC